MNEPTYESSNVNAIHLKNLYQNIINLEMLEKRAINGYNNILDIMQIPYGLRDIEIAYVKYSTLKEMISEFVTLLTDIIPIITETEFKDFKEKLSTIKLRVKNKDLYLNVSINSIKNRIKHVSLTEQFDLDFETLIDLRRDVIRKIAHIIYIKETKGGKPWQTMTT